MAKKTKRAKKTKNNNLQVYIKAKISDRQRKYNFSLPRDKISSLLQTAKRMEKIGENVLKRQAGLAKKDLLALKSELMKDKNVAKARSSAKKGLKSLKAR